MNQHLSTLETDTHEITRHSFATGHRTRIQARANNDKHEDEMCAMHTSPSNSTCRLGTVQAHTAAAVSSWCARIEHQLWESGMESAKEPLYNQDRNGRCTSKGAGSYRGKGGRHGRTCATPP
jgi:hypothetical protein